MVKEKHRICVKNGIFQSANVRRQLGSFSPFGDHFGPGLHAGGPDPNGHAPPISPPSMVCGPGWGPPQFSRVAWKAV